MGNEMGNTNVPGFKAAEDEKAEEPKIEAEGAAYDDGAGTEIHQALLFPSSSSGAKDSDESLQVLSSDDDDDDGFGRNEETTLCATDKDSNESPQLLSTDDDPFGGDKELTPSCATARDSQTEEGEISQLAFHTKHETDEVENASGEAQSEAELLFKTEPENFYESENTVSIVEDENLSTKEDDQDQPTIYSSEKLQPLAPENIVSTVEEEEDENLSTKEDDQASEKLESLAPENIVSIVKDEDENLSTKEDDQDPPTTISSEKLESSLLTSSQNHQLDCEISNEQLIPEITLTTEENELESESSIFSNRETIQTGKESNDHSLVVDSTLDPPDLEEKLEATEVQDDKIPESEDNEKEDMAAGAHEVGAMLEEDTTTRLSIESISENPCLQMELTKSPSFGFPIEPKPRIEESDQTPLLCHGRGVATETETETEEEEKIDHVEEEIKTIKMEKSDDNSEKVETEKHDGSLMGKKEPACIDIALASSKSGSWKKKIKHSNFFGSCICCAAAASTN